MAENPTTDGDGVPYLTEEEIKSFLDDLDHNGDGIIDYSEVEQKLDAAHDELTPQPKKHHIMSKNRDSKDDRLRHQFLRSIIGSDAHRIPRSEFAERVKEWKIPSPDEEKKEQDGQKAYVRKMSNWRRAHAYWAVHGPDIAFLMLVVSMQIAFGTWQLVKYLNGPQYRAAFGWGVVLAKTSAGALYPTLFFLILSMSRYFSTFLRGSYYISRFINFDLSQSFHIKISIVAITLATLHAIGHLSGSFNHGSRPEHESAVAALLGPDAVPRPYIVYVRSIPGFTGLTALGLFYLLAGLSMPQVRKWSYEVFQLGHLLMFPIIGLLMAHGTAALLQAPMLGYWLAFPTLLVLIERLTRLGRGFYGIKATIRVLDGETVEITAMIPSERFWKYKAGQYVFLQIPKISRFQWHPFTVSVCVGQKMQLHIKTDGNWTKQLRDLGGESGTAEIEVGINGPFGAPAQRFYDFNHTIIVGAGIGVTPFSGILADLQARDDKERGGPGRLRPDHHSSESNATVDKTEKNGKGEITKAADGSDPTKVPNPSDAATFADDYRRVDFHWIVRDRNYLLWLSDLLNAVYRSQEWHHEHDPHQHLDIRIQTHVTQKRRSIVTHVYRWLLEMHRTDEHPESPLTGLLNSTHFGRPDFVTILDKHYEDMRKFRASKRVLEERREGSRSADEEEDEELKVGVFYCGSPIVGEILADRCRQLSVMGRHDGSKIEYHFMMEVFG